MPTYLSFFNSSIGVSARSLPAAVLGSLLASLAIGCGGDSSGGGALAQSGGTSTQTGGSPAAGGNVASGNGGTLSENGGTTTGHGGTAAIGGSVTGVGGAIATGGLPATGGAATGGAATGGATTSTGGASAKGGATTGGAVATGGAAGKGGASTGGASTSAGATVGAGGTTAASTDLWIAPNGSDSNPGTEASPLATLTAAHTRVTAGQTIWLKSGTYSWSSTVKLTKNGTASSPINVFAAAGARPVIDFSAQTCGDSAARGIQITGTYWHLKGFDVQKAGDNCIHIGGAYNTVEWVVTHNCCDSGLQITADTASDPSRGANNTILNCDSYDNYDTPTGGENADGFAPKLHIGAGNVFRGCRSWNNADDGYDLFASDDIVTIENCWAFLNGVLSNGSGTSAGDGNGFKLGGAATAGDAYEGGAPHKVTNCFAFENTACGYTRNNNTSVPVLSQCGGRGDGKGEYCSLTNPSPITFTMTGAQAKAVARNADGSLPAIK